MDKKATDTTSPRAQAKADASLRKQTQAQVRDYLTGVSRFNLGALFMPPIWGPAHGMFATLLWYPAWILADNMVFTAYSLRSATSIVFAVLTIVILVAFAFYFSYAMQPRAALYCIEHGKTKEQFQRRQRRWAVLAIVLAALMLGFATYYNLNLRPLVGA